jgi:cytochrome c-type biogenesis protein CcmE
MSQKTAKVGITVLVLATAFGVLLYTSLGESRQFYKYTDEVMASPAEWQGKSLQVHGFVVPGSIAMKPGTLEYRFDMQRNGKVMRAFYTGIVPDTFKDESEVVAFGRLVPAAEMQAVADKICAKPKKETVPAASVQCPIRTDAEQALVVDATELSAKCPSKYEGARKPTDTNFK